MGNKEAHETHESHEKKNKFYGFLKYFVSFVCFVGKISFYCAVKFRSVSSSVTGTICGANR